MSDQSFDRVHALSENGQAILKEQYEPCLFFDKRSKNAFFTIFSILLNPFFPLLSGFLPKSFLLHPSSFSARGLLVRHFFMPRWQKRRGKEQEKLSTLGKFERFSGVGQGWQKFTYFYQAYLTKNEHAVWENGCAQWIYRLKFIRIAFP